MTPETKSILLGQVRTWAAVAAGSAATHGLISGGSTEAVAGAIVGAVVGFYSWYDKYGRDIIDAQFEVLKAKSLAQAAAMKANNIPKVTVAQIAAQSPVMGPTEVARVVATLPLEIKTTVAGASAPQN